MLPLYEDPHFTFRFAEDRVIPRFHLEGVSSGEAISVFKIDPATGQRLSLLAMATVGEGGWVELPEPLVVMAGEAFIAVKGVSHLPLSIRSTLLTTLAVSGPLAVAGYLWGLVQGKDNQYLLAAGGIALGVLVVFLGYGPIALLIGALGATAQRFHKKKNSTEQSK